MMTLCKAVWEMLAARSGYPLKEFTGQRTGSARVGGVRRQSGGAGSSLCLHKAHGRWPAGRRSIGFLSGEGRERDIF